MWANNFYLAKTFNSFLLDLATPKNLLWRWNFGFMLGMFMVIQIASGFTLALYYCDYVNYAFISAEYLMDEIFSGFMFRFIHSSGASMLFFSIFMHMGRSIWYKSFMVFEVWMIGVLIFSLTMMVSFSGYVLPWGQMSFWAATVITNLLYVLPYWGEDLLKWVWGGFSVGGPTLSRFFILHYIIPFVILIMSVLHLVFLHLSGSSNPVGITTSSEKVEFYWSYFLKDLYFFLLIVLIFMLMLFLIPYFFMDAENFLAVDFMKTPEHIKPEWYFLFAYCISRSIPNKVGGVLGLSMSILILFLIPSLSSSSFKFISWMEVKKKSLFFSSFVMLTWLGGCLVEWPYSMMGIMISLSYFCSVFQLSFLFRK